MKGKLLLFFFIFISFSSCSKEDDEVLTWEHPDVSFFKRIWNAAPHCAFTDLIEYNSKYYCCLREAEDHLPVNNSTYGKIRVLESVDGESWYSIGLVRDENYDLRDPKFSITANNQLMLSYGCSAFIDGQFGYRKNMFIYIFSNPEQNQPNFNHSQSFFIPVNQLLPTYWLWRIIWHQNQAYSIAYTFIYPVLLTSKDGINYMQLSELDFFPDAHEVSEADLKFLSDEKLMIIIRSNRTNGYLATSSYPYDKWEWKALEYTVHCPKIFEINSHLFVTGRGDAGKNVVYHIKNDILYPIYDFPGEGDSAYPGVIVTNNEVWISYYTTQKKRTSVYLVKIPKENILSKIGMN